MSRDRVEDLPTETIHAIAEVERGLRGSSVEQVEVRLGGDGARLSFVTGRYADHFRGSITASAIETLRGSAWHVSTVHDPLDVDGGGTQSMLTLLLDEDDVPEVEDDDVDEPDEQVPESVRETIETARSNDSINEVEVDVDEDLRTDGGARGATDAEVEQAIEAIERNTEDGGDRGDRA
jgi:hypothetical protein